MLFHLLLEQVDTEHEVITIVRHVIVLDELDELDDD